MGGHRHGVWRVLSWTLWEVGLRGVFGRGVGWRVCVAFLEVLVTCADVLLAPGGRRRLAACVVDGGLAAAAAGACVLR